MHRVAVLPFRLGSSVIEKIPLSYAEFYKWLANSFLSKGCIFAQSPEKINTIPISNNDVQNEPQKIASVFIEFYREFKNRADVFLIDLSRSFHGIHRGSTLLFLCEAIGIVLETADKDITFFLLLNEKPHPSDPALRFLTKFLENESVIIIDNNGSFLPEKIYNPSFSKEQYLRKIATVNETPLDIIKKKMIKRLGHFTRLHKDKSEYCVRYFYDGSLCEEELPDLIWNTLLEEIEGFNSVIFLYHSPMSKWLEKSIMTLSIEKEFKTINLANPSENCLINKIEPSQKIILILDLVDTGHTATRLIRELFANSVVPDLYLSILTTKIINKDSMIREITVDDCMVEIKCMIKVEQRNHEKDCPMCVLNLPKNQGEEFQENQLMLSSFDHWELALEFGLKPEEDTPEYREPINRVINYPALIKENGAWLASKIRKRLEIEGLLSDAIVICPDNEVGSRELTEFMKLVLGVSVIRIPRTVINQCIDNGENLKRLNAEWEDNPPDWYKNLIRITDANIIVMDEFNASGKTFIGLKNLLLLFGQGVVCYFPLNDLNPNWSNNCGSTVFTLYEWQSFETN